MLLKMEENGVVKGWANASGQEEADLKSFGFVESSEEERQSIISKKHNIKEESATIAPAREAVKGKPGRKPKNFYLGNHGDNSNKD